jgi:23S rRNA (pseudouridine1915-N3)-methyltransferase
MKINLVAVGNRMPAWVETGVAEYSKRLPRDFSFTVTEVAMGQRGKSADIARAIAKEGEAMQQQLNRTDHVVALDVKGKLHSTESMAQRVDAIRNSGKNLALLVGGPDGLAPECLAQADESWSLSALTLPHPVVRIVVAEQIYRVWSLLNNHPYHRA